MLPYERRVVSLVLNNAHARVVDELLLGKLLLYVDLHVTHGTKCTLLGLVHLDSTSALRAGKLRQRILDGGKVVYMYFLRAMGASLVLGLCYVVDKYVITVRAYLADESVLFDIDLAAAGAALDDLLGKNKV